MGNEMGNNNVSGLQEEEKARTDEDQRKFLHEENHADELEGENRTKLEAEEKDFHEKRELNENGEATDFHEILVPSETLLADLAVEEPPEENETSDENEYIEAKNQTVDSKAGSGERDPNSDQQEVVQAEQVAEGISIPQSENGHPASNEVAENMYLCVKPETGDQTVVAGLIPVEAKADEDEFEMLFRENKFVVSSPEEVITCSENEHDVDQSPLHVLQLPQEAPESAVEASSQLGAMNSPLVESEAPKDALNSPLETLEAPPEASESPIEASHPPQPLALSLLIKASDSPLEESETPLDALNPTLETLEPPLEALESPLETSDPRPLALELIVKASDPSFEASNSQLEASEPSIETSEPPSEDSDPRVEASKSRLKTQLEASELPLDALDPPLEASESQLEAFPQASLINPSEVYELHDKTINVKEAIATQPMALELIVKASDPSLEASNSELEASEPLTSDSPSEGSDPPVEATMLRLETQLEATYTPLEVLESQLEAFPRASSINSSQEVYEPHDKTINVKEAIPITKEQPAMEESMLLNEESKRIGSEVENKENKGDYIKTQFCDQELKGLKTDDFIASQLEFLASETDSKKNSEQSAHELDSTNGIGENCQLEDLEAKCNEDQVAFADKSLKLDCFDVADMMSEIEAVSTESDVTTEYKHDEDRPAEEIGDKEKASLLENDRDRGDIVDDSMLLNTGNHAQDVPPYFPDSEAFKDKNELISDLKAEFVIITERYHASPSVAIVQSMMPTPEKEALQNIQETSVMDEQNAKGQETVEKLMTEPSSDYASNHVEFRKSPSFHFDLSTETKCEECDQTPLLCHDKAAGTSLISRDEAMFQKDNVQSDYSAPRNEDVLVEEKTIRMERSDSERPSAPFLSFLQKQESAEILATQEKQEKNAAAKKTRRDPWTVIHKTFALTSPRDSNGKRKAKSSIFSTCICCATKTP